MIAKEQVQVKNWKIKIFESFSAVKGVSETVPCPVVSPLHNKRRRKSRKLIVLFTKTLI
jgi:hypothetical protein